MALRSFGKVAVAAAGTPVVITTNESSPTARVGIQAIFVQALAGNSGTNVYLGNATMNKSTLAGVYAIIPKTLTQGVQLKIDLAPAGINANELYLDVDTDGDAALVSAAEQ